MNEWLITYVRHGLQTARVKADTLDEALRKFRINHHDIPAVALISISAIGEEDISEMQQ